MKSVHTMEILLLTNLVGGLLILMILGNAR